MIHFDGKLEDFIDWKTFIKKYGVDKGGYVQKLVDKRVIDYCVPYVPSEEDILARSAYTATEIGSGEVFYDQAYAHYQYYGEIWGPNFPIVENGVITGWRSPPEKHPTGRPLQYNTDKNPLAGSHWFDRAMADHSEDVLKEAQDAANRGSHP